MTTDATPAVAHSKLTSAQSGPYRDEAAVVDWQADVRGGCATGVRGETPTDGSGRSGEDGPSVRDSTGPSFRSVTVDSDALGDLGTSIEETIEQLGSGVGSLSPAELRLCFESITPIVADYDDRDVRRFLLGVTETVERFDGMAHYHLPAEYDSETVDSIEALFDAVVEVQYGSGGIEQRWHLADPDITTDWLAL
ncbi:DUF7504 family protein [Halorussus caseinilyticus]|uniref:Halobacterial output domain-containing protein n=1 Tax=Halorussus caseinilyticus TaxID=3034025 RepID=A0ABD5WJ43_9EURY